MKKIGIKKIIGIFAVLALLPAAFIWIVSIRIGGYAAYDFENIEELPECDAVLVLGAKANRDGTPSLALKDRLDYALELYEKGKVKKILASGDHGTKEYDEVNAMLNYLLDKGVPREDIFLDHAGFDTYDSIYRARDVFLVESVIISTQEFHMPRSLYIARNLGLESYGYSCDDKMIYNMFYLNARESLARVKAFLEVEVLHANPKYLGEAIPISGDGTATDG